MGEAAFEGAVEAWASVHYKGGVRLHLIDGTYELFRAHFSHRPSHVVEGRELKASAALAASLTALLHDPAEAVSHAAIAFDNPIRSVRNEWYPPYKSDEGVPPELRAQFDEAERVAHALGLVVWSMDRFEADDALATGAARFRERVDQVRLLTPDKDLGQSIVGQRVILVDRQRRLEIDEATLWQRRGLRPASVPDWLALVGDEADGLPGLRGFGEKTAAVLLERFGHLEAIPEDPRLWPATVRAAPRLAATLARERQEAALYRKLATLIVDVPLAEDLDELAWLGVPRAEFAPWCERLRLPALRDRITRWRA